MLRLVLTCLLAVVIPLKGMAGVGMVGCGPSHHGPSAAVMQAAHAVAPEVLGGMDVRGGQAMHGGQELAGAQNHGDAKKPTVDPGKLMKVKCSSCAPCCAAAAPASEVARFVDLMSGEDGPTFFAYRYRGVFSDVPLHPPR